jgi:multiple sugar transport system permease protein
MKTKAMTSMRAEARAAALFLAPALVILLIFFLLPVVAGFALSLTDFDLYSLGDIHNVRFVALHNYAAILRSEIFWTALGNTLYFSLVGGPLTVAVSLGAALLVNAKAARLKPLFRTIYFAPVVTTLVAVSVVFRFFYHPRFGALNRALGAIGLPQIDWLGDPRWAMPAIILLAVWKNFGYNMIIFIAGLQAIPDELYEASRIDGAGTWRQFRHITLPMLGPTFLFVGIVTAIGYLQLFAEPYVMTYGGPLNRTLSAVMMMYKEGFRWWRMGYAAAVAFLLCLVILLATAVQLRFSQERPEKS